MSDDPAATSWTRGQTAAFDVPRGPTSAAPDAARVDGSSVDGSGVDGWRSSSAPIGSAPTDAPQNGSAPSESVQSGAVQTDSALTDVSHGDPLHADAEYPPLERRRSPLLGVLALIALVASVAVQIGAIAVASAGDYVPGTALAIASIALSGIAVLAGLVALIVARGRILGIISVVLGLLTNPLLLVAVLGYLA